MQDVISNNETELDEQLKTVAKLRNVQLDEQKTKMEVEMKIFKAERDREELQKTLEELKQQQTKLSDMLQTS